MKNFDLTLRTAEESPIPPPLEKPVDPTNRVAFLCYQIPKTFSDLIISYMVNYEEKRNVPSKQKMSLSQVERIFLKVGAISDFAQLKKVNKTKEIWVPLFWDCPGILKDFLNVLNDNDETSSSLGFQIYVDTVQQIKRYVKLKKQQKKKIELNLTFLTVLNSKISQVLKTVDSLFYEDIK